MITVKKLYEELQQLMDDGLEECQLYGVKSPLMLKKYGKMREDHLTKTKYIDVSDEENW